MEKEEILKKLPFGPSFRFVDTLERVDADGAEGSFYFNPGLGFYEDHFPGQAVTPGVLLTECCAQIGLVCLGIYLADSEGIPAASFVLSSTEMQFFKPVYPGSKVVVRSQKHYFRFNKLKCGVHMYSENNELVCKGILAGMLIGGQHE